MSLKSTPSVHWCHQAPACGRVWLSLRPTAWPLPVTWVVPLETTLLSER
jgi:hypothetical protein